MLESAIRAIEEQVLLLRHIARHSGNESAASEALLKHAHRAEQQRDLVRRAVLEYPDYPEHPEAPEPAAS